MHLTMHIINYSIKMSVPASPIEISTIESIADCLENQIVYNYNHGRINTNKTRFDAKLKTEIPLRVYVKNLFENIGMEIVSFQYSVLLIEKYCMNASIYLTKDNCYKLILTAILISLKINEDCVLSDVNYAKMTGIKLACLIKLESNFLETLDYKVANLAQ